MPDSAHIQESDAEFANRKGLRAGKSVVEPLYTVDDAYKALQHFHTHEFGEMLEVLPGVQVKFKVAGHILGSAIVEVFVNEDGKQLSSFLPEILDSLISRLSRIRKKFPEQTL